MSDEKIKQIAGLPIIERLALRWNAVPGWHKHIRELFKRHVGLITLNDVCALNGRYLLTKKHFGPAALNNVQTVLASIFLCLNKETDAHFESIAAYYHSQKRPLNDWPVYLLIDGKSLAMQVLEDSGIKTIGQLTGKKSVEIAMLRDHYNRGFSPLEFVLIKMRIDQWRIKYAIPPVLKAEEAMEELVDVYISEDLMYRIEQAAQQQTIESQEFIRRALEQALGK